MSSFGSSRVEFKTFTNIESGAPTTSDDNIIKAHIESTQGSGIWTAQSGAFDTSDRLYLAAQTDAHRKIEQRTKEQDDIEVSKFLLTSNRKASTALNNIVIAAPKEKTSEIGSFPTFVKVKPKKKRKHSETRADDGTTTKQKSDPEKV